MQESHPPVAHARLVGALHQAVRGSATILDARAQGIEQVVLLLADEGGARQELHLLLLGPVLHFWLEPAAGKAATPATGFGDWLRRRLTGARIACASEGSSGRILRLDLDWAAAAAPAGRIAAEPDDDGAGGAGDARPAALVLDPSSNAYRLMVLDAQGRVAQRYPPTVRAGAQGRGAPGGLYEEPGGRQPDARELSSHSASDDPLVTFAAARELGQARIRLARAEECARRMRKGLRAELRHLERLQASLTAELEESRGGAGWRRRAEALLAHARQVPKGARRVTLEDPSEPGQKLSIELDPTVGVGQNAKKIFQKAARLERSLAMREKKVASCETLLAALHDWLELPALAERRAAGAADGKAGDRDADGEREQDPTAGAGAGDVAAETVADLQAVYQEARKRIDTIEPGIRRRWQASVNRWRDALVALDQPIDRAGYESRRVASATPAEPGVHPRRFLLPGGWEVLVGRSNRENDALTHKIAKPDDLWLHARGVAGSHVVLRCAGRGSPPGKATIAQAASIAAYFSKARTSGTVPVIYAEKRFVRKPRKAAPGLAVCLREKVVMAPPRLPPA